MLLSHVGELAALTTAICWTLTAIAFESAGKRVGSLSVNIIRLVIAFILLTVFTFLTRGIGLPIDASSKTWFWLLTSGIIGFVIGDLFLFQAYVEIGSRISLLIMSVVPPITAITGYLLMGEKIKPLGILGMLITIVGIALVILSRSSSDKRVKLAHPAKGLLFAFIGALGQAFGLIFSKFGMGDYNPFAATQIRIIAAIIGFCIVITVGKRWGDIATAFKDKLAIRNISIGAFFGPFLGVSFSLLAVQHIPTGIVSTITSISPILIIPASIMIFKEKVLRKEILGAAISITGVVLLFI
ncbi:MAG: DMT family transporter [Lutisporaceae bacterium]